MTLLVIIYAFVLSLLTFLFCHIIHERKMKRDLAFFVISNYILSFSFLIFFFYYKDFLLSIANIILLLINTIFLNYEIKLTYDKYKLLSVPYLIYIVLVLFIIFDLLLMSR
ncbi:MAG: tryptophan-rich sensory protein [Bacilli bacterium]|nr:tryptophan-rich sensory protein [Bacilli bacterium]